MAITSINQVNKRQFINRFLQTEVKNGTVDIPAAQDSFELSESSATVSPELALKTAAKIQQLAGLGMGGALPILISAALLKSSWGDAPAPTSPVPRPPDDPKLLQQLPENFVTEERERQLAVAQRLAKVGGQHEVEFLVNATDYPASVAGDEVWINLPIAAQVFPSDDLLAFAMAHEKGHIINGDVSWEPSGTGVLWEVMTEAYKQVEQTGDRNAAQVLDTGISVLEQSFNANAQRNEVEADLAAVDMVEKAGFDRKPGLAFLLTTAGDAHHPPGNHRVAAIRQHLAGTERAITDQELEQIVEMAKGMARENRGTPKEPNRS